MNYPETKTTAVTNRIAYLVCAFIQDSISEQEQIELNRWLDDDSKNSALFEAVTMGNAWPTKPVPDWNQYRRG